MRKDVDDKLARQKTYEEELTKKATELEAEEISNGFKYPEEVGKETRRTIATALSASPCDYIKLGSIVGNLDFSKGVWDGFDYYLFSHLVSDKKDDEQFKQLLSILYDKNLFPSFTLLRELRTTTGYSHTHLCVVHRATQLVLESHQK